MKLNSKNIGLLMVTLVAVSVGTTILVVTGIPTTKLDTMLTAPILTGNVKIAVYDKETGLVKAYRQTDNHIVVHGMAIIAGQVFNDTRFQYGYGNADSLFNFTGVSTVKYMDIGNDTVNPDDQPGWDNVTLHSPLKDSNNLASPNCDRVLADIRNQSDNDGEAPAGLLAQINVTAIATFDGANCAATDIYEAGIWTDDNSTSNGLRKGLMFARNTFLPVSLSTSDSLELTWTFTFTDS